MSGKDKPIDDARRNIDRLVNQHTEALYSYALMRVGKPDVAEDMVQDALLAALQSWQSFAGDSSERTWLIGILSHKILDFFRRNSRREDVDDETWRTEYFNKSRHWKDRMLSWKADPETLAEDVDFRRVLQDCLRELSRVMAQAFVMREIEGCSSEEVCKHLEISQTNLWVRLHRARLQLRRCLELNWFS
ncbi:MAG: sigma-70 family RNA polymerase sigma factor [Phycisphaerae bacterium]|nr:sigma-70 family RNA polymerase sigma factor [Phycisphaerae bacterium]